MVELLTRTYLRVAERQEIVDKFWKVWQGDMVSYHDHVDGVVESDADQAIPRDAGA